MNEHPRINGKRRRIKFSHVLLALLLVGIAAFAIFRIRTKFRLRAGIDAVRASGSPVTCADLNQWYTIPPDAENAAYVIDEAISYLAEWDKEKSRALPLVGRAELPPRTEAIPAEMRDLMAEYVADNNEALELFHEAAKIEHCRYPIDLSAGFATVTPNLGEIRAGVRLLELEAILHAEAGDGAAAAHSAASGFGVARSLAREPLTISQLVRAACQRRAVLAVEQVLNRAELSDEQLSGLVESVRNSEQVSDISLAFLGERCVGISFFKNPQAMDPSLTGGGIPARPILAIYGALGLTDSDAVIHLDLMDGYIKSTQLPLHERQQAVDAVEAKLQSISKAHVLLHMIMPALSRITTIEMRAIAHLRAADIALAVQRYRLAADELPDELADLVPAYLETVPKDPFDGNDLRYRKLEPGFVVYSVGEDLSDDGGKEKPAKTTRGGEPVKWDVTFIVER